MYQAGDVIVYSAHGLCQIQEICERTISDETRLYYVMHPLADTSLTISCPVDSDKVMMLDPLEKDEAEQILSSFALPGIDWIDDYRQRSARYRELIKAGNRATIATIANSLLYRELDLKDEGKHLYEVDRKLLADIQSILFNELALALDTTYEDIVDRIQRMISERYEAAKPTTE